MLLDEPFASIDVALRQKLRADMRRLLKARSTPAVLVTHDPAEAIELGDRIAVMQEGRIVETATPVDLYRAPASLAGACIFPGAQAFPCAPVDVGVTTEFGAVGIDGASGATAIVVHDGGVSARTDPDGTCAVIDCRFEGPHWLLTIVGPAGGQARALSERPVPLGVKATISIDPAMVRVVAS
jgi:iron(III) transport system ATP-binding protein